MKYFKLALLVLLPIILVITLMMPISNYDVKAYQQFNELDKHLIACEQQNGFNLVDTIKNLKQSINETVSLGMTYDKTTNPSSYFLAVETHAEQLQLILNSLSACNYDFSEIDLTKVSPQATELVQNLLEKQKQHLELFKSLYNELTILLQELKPFEETFYLSKATKASEYYHEIDVIFEKIKTIQNEQMATYESYVATKTELFNLITK